MSLNNDDTFNDIKIDDHIENPYFPSDENHSNCKRFFCFEDNFDDFEVSFDNVEPQVRNELVQLCVNSKNVKKTKKCNCENEELKFTEITDMNDLLIFNGVDIYAEFKNGFDEAGIYDTRTFVDFGDIDLDILNNDINSVYPDNLIIVEEII